MRITIKTKKNYIIFTFNYIFLGRASCNSLFLYKFAPRFSLFFNNKADSKRKTVIDSPKVYKQRKHNEKKDTDGTSVLVIDCLQLR